MSAELSLQLPLELPVGFRDIQSHHLRNHFLGSLLDNYKKRLEREKALTPEIWLGGISMHEDGKSTLVGGSTHRT